jgi:hypothetical protein
VVLVVVAGFALPGMTSPHGGPVSQQVLVFGAALLMLTAAASVIALFSSRWTDKAAGGLSGSLAVWLIYAFVRAFL